MPCDRRRLATYAAAALVSTAALFWLQPAQVVPPTTEQLRKEPLVTSVFAHTCSSPRAGRRHTVPRQVQASEARRGRRRGSASRGRELCVGGAPELPELPGRPARERDGGLSRRRRPAMRAGGAPSAERQLRANCLSLAVAVDAATDGDGARRAAGPTRC